MSRLRRVEALLQLAEEDVDAATALLVVGNRYAAYHCQQGAEKLIKAILLRLGLESGPEHRIDVLVEKIPPDQPHRTDLQSLERLTPYATTYRYPTPGGRIPSAPDRATVEADIAQLRELIQRLRTT